MIKRQRKILFISLTMVFLFFLSMNGPAIQQVEQNDIFLKSDVEIGRWIIKVDINNLENNDYQGYLKVYVVEPLSRWNDYDGDPYHYGFLDFAYDGDIEVSDSLTKELSWNPSWKSNWDIDKDNIMVIAVLFNGQSELRYSIPDTQQNEFDAYFVDAAAAATPDTHGYNTVNDEFSHTVFTEKGSVTWCPACPKVSNILHTIYSSDEYPFYFVSMVADENNGANKRLMDDLSMYYVPTTYCDGGYIVQVGQTVEQTFRSYIEACGQREVPQMNLSVSFFWEADETPPSITITKPGSGLYFMNEKKKDMDVSVIFGIIDVEATAIDEESGIAKVEFYVNGELRSETNRYPYRFRNWKEDRIFGRYTIQAIAYDEAGNTNADQIEVIRFF